jgi:hypothetical protein
MRSIQGAASEKYAALQLHKWARLFHAVNSRSDAEQEPLLVDVDGAPVLPHEAS